MKKVILATLFASLVMIAGGAYADTTACGGTIVQNKDISGDNDRSYAASCCPSGYRVQGVAYNDVHDSDFADAIGVVCRSIQHGNDVLPSDYNKSPKTFVCDKNEVMAGIYCKDTRKGNDNRDELDGCTAVCQHPGSTELRRVYNHDLKGGREGQEMTVLLPKRVVGVVYKDLDKGKSDRADGASISVK